MQNLLARACRLQRFPCKRSLFLSLTLEKRDKYSLKNIGPQKSPSSGKSKAPSFKKYGGSKEFPVTLFHLPGKNSDAAYPRKDSRHKLMVENMLHTAIENLICSGKIADELEGCPLEITQVVLSTNFSCATVSWKLDDSQDSISEADAEKLLSDNIEFIRNMLPAFHSLTHTPSVSFVRDDNIEKQTLLEEAFENVKQSNNTIK